jgi:glycosyltransferase involved in cell wall biosynthesis
MPIKSVHITNYYHKNSGGISTSFNNLMDAAARHQRYVRLIVPGETEHVEDVNDFAKIYYIPANYSPIFDKRYRLIMPWRYMLHGSPIREILLDENPDIVEITDKYTLSLFGVMVRRGKFSALGRRPLVHFSCERMDDNIDSFLFRGRLGKWIARRAMGNFLIPSYDFHIANSEYTAEEFFEATEDRRHSKWLFNKSWRFFSAPRTSLNDRVYVCPRGVNTTRFGTDRSSDKVKAEMRQKAGASDDTVLLLYAGRLSPEKNIELLPEILRSLSKNDIGDYRLLIAGAGPKAEWLANECEKAAPGKAVQLGHLEKDGLADLYANADVFIHPNPREPFGIAPLEAMASGAPVVAPRGGGILSYANDENAWLVEPTGDAFAAAIKDIITNAELRKMKTAAAMKAVEANTREASTDRLFAAYDDLYERYMKQPEMFDGERGFDYAEKVLN